MTQYFPDNSQGGGQNYGQDYNQDYGQPYQNDYGYEYYEQPPQKRNTALVATVTGLATALIMGGIAYFGGKYVGETTVEPVTHTTTSTELSTTTETTTVTTTSRQSIPDAVRDRFSTDQREAPTTGQNTLDSLLDQFVSPNSNDTN